MEKASDRVFVRGGGSGQVCSTPPQLPLPGAEGGSHQKQELVWL